MDRLIKFITTDTSQTLGKMITTGIVTGTVTGTVTASVNNYLTYKKKLDIEQKATGLGDTNNQALNNKKPPYIKTPLECDACWRERQDPKSH